jgi:hypothetical protein
MEEISKKNKEEDLSKIYYAKSIPEAQAEEVVTKKWIDKIGKIGVLNFLKEEANYKVNP